MLHARTIFFLLFLSGVSCVAQTPLLDSLKQSIPSSHDEHRVEALVAYGNAVLAYDYRKSQTAIDEAYTLAKKIGYPKGIAEALLYRGIIEYSLGKDSLALRTFQDAIALSRRLKNRVLEGRVEVSKASVLRNLGQLDSALHSFQTAYQLLRDSVAPEYLAVLYLNYSRYYKSVGQPAAEIQFLHRSWVIGKRLPDKTSLAWIGVAIADYYSHRGNYGTARAYIDTARRRLGADTVRSEPRAVLDKQEGMILTSLGDHTRALDLFADVKHYYEVNPYPLDFVRVLMEIGYVQVEVSNFEIGLKYYFQALRICNEKSYPMEKSLILFRIAWAYYMMGQNSLATKFAKETLTLTQQHHQKFEEASAWNILGLLADRAKNDNEALKNYLAALDIRTQNKFEEGVASTLLNIGLLYERQNQFAKAEEYELKSLALEEKIQHAIGICYSYQSLGQLYTRSQQLAKADLYLTKAERLAKQIRAADVALDVYRNKRDLYEARGDFRQALYFANRYDALRDSLFSKSLSNRILTLQHDYELDQRDNQISLLNKERQLQDSKLQLQNQELSQQRTILIVTIIILVAVLIIAYIIYTYYRRVKELNQAVHEQNEEITAQSEELQEANQVLSKLNREISEQKEEIQAQSEELIESNRAIASINETLEEKIRARTAELKEAYTELDTFFYRSSHDFRRPLTTFMGLAEVAKIMLKDPTALELFSKVNDTARSLDKMLNKLQTVNLANSDELVKSEIVFGLLFETEIANHQEELLAKGIATSVHVSLSSPFYSYLPLIRVMLQNLLENSISFAGVINPAINVSAVDTGDAVQIIVSDNGQGVPPAYVSRVWEMYFRGNERSTGNGLGLYIVKKMVDRLSGQATLVSEHHVGTTVTITLPRT